MILGGLLVLLVGFRSNDGTADFLSVLACLTLVPTIIAVAFFYFYTRKREQELLTESSPSERDSAQPDAPAAGVEQSTD
jgi:Na+/H+ antiporter NhaD/arsenite permease-like protein